MGKYCGVQILLRNHTLLKRFKNTLLSADCQMAYLGQLLLEIKTHRTILWRPITFAKSHIAEWRWNDRAPDLSRHSLALALTVIEIVIALSSYHSTNINWNHPAKSRSRQIMKMSTFTLSDITDWKRRDAWFCLTDLWRMVSRWRARFFLLKNIWNCISAVTGWRQVLLDRSL